MTDESVRRLGGILAVQAEIEGMKTSNAQYNNQVYGEEDFFRCKEMLALISTAADHQINDYINSL